MTRATFVLRAEWWKLAVQSLAPAVWAVAIAAVLSPLAPQGDGVALFAAIAGPLSLFGVVRVTMSGIYVYPDRVVVRGVIRSVRLNRRQVTAVSVRRDNLLWNGPICVGVETHDGMVVAPSTLSGQRGAARTEYLIYSLATALGVPGRSSNR